MQWETAADPVPYDDALARMERHVAAMQRGEADELIWLVEHPPLYTAGTSARPQDLLSTALPVHATGRGGQYTYHGPGQRIAYLMLDLNRRGRDVRAYVQTLERWIIATLARFGVEGFVREGRVGVWVNELALFAPAGAPALSHRESSRSTRDGRAMKEAKIAALGVRVQRWITSHGIALNVYPDLSHYGGIVPCGIREYGVTSLQALGVDARMAAVDAALKDCFNEVFSRSDAA